MKRLLMMVACLVLAVSAQAASFDCAKAGTKVEKLICDTLAISKLDDELGKAYQYDLSKATEEQKQLLITEQKHWLKYTRNACEDETCLKLAYWSRQAGLATFFEPKSPLYKHETDKAETIKQVLATTQLELIKGATDVPNFCTQMFDDLKQMKGIRFIDPVVQTQSYEDPALDKVKQHCRTKPPLHYSRGCLPNIAMGLSAGKKGFEEGLALCDVGFGLPPFKLFELAPIKPSEKSRFIFYADDAYGPMNLTWKKPSLGGGYSAGFQQINPSKCESVKKNGTGMNAGISTDERNRKNYNSIIEYKNQYYFFVLRSYMSSRWWLAIQSVTPFRAKNQKTCNWSPVISESTSNQGSN
jgi:uncharacterized protein